MITPTMPHPREASAPTNWPDTKPSVPVGALVLGLFVCGLTALALGSSFYWAKGINLVLILAALTLAATALIVAAVHATLTVAVRARSGEDGPVPYWDRLTALIRQHWRAVVSDGMPHGETAPLGRVFVGTLGNVLLYAYGVVALASEGTISWSPVSPLVDLVGAAGGGVALLFVYRRHLIAPRRVWAVICDSATRQPLAALGTAAAVSAGLTLSLTAYTLAVTAPFALRADMPLVPVFTAGSLVPVITVAVAVYALLAPTLAALDRPAE